MNIELSGSFYLVEKEFKVFIKMPLPSFRYYFLVPFLSHNVQMEIATRILSLSQS